MESLFTDYSWAEGSSSIGNRLSNERVGAFAAGSCEFVSKLSTTCGANSPPCIQQVGAGAPKISEPVSSSPQQQNVESKPDIFSTGSEDPETGNEYESLMTDLSP